MQAGLYKHYKGGYYQVLGIAQHSETRERMVVYVSLDVSKDGPRLCVRPIVSFEGFVQVPSKTIPALQPRFQFIGDGFPE